MSLGTPDKIRRLQRTLYVTAKQSPARRFHVLYDKVWRDDILAYAYALDVDLGPRRRLRAKHLQPKSRTI